MDYKFAIVTGGTRGIGLACAKKLLKDGYYVFATYAHSEENAKKAKKQLEKISPLVDVTCVDSSNPIDVHDLLSRIRKIYNRLDVLVNNVGIVKDASIFNMDLETFSFDDIINTNIKGNLLFMREAVKMFMYQQKSGSIINISSVSSIFGNPGQTLYSATKGAINSATITAAKELAPFGIRVNAVAPGFIDTDMLKKIPEAKMKKYLNMIPMQKIGDPEDVANAVSFLASDQSKYITGQILTIDGGLSI